ncbi:MAG: zinc-ribbon domain-containing protein [Candidatus Goldiibacteriota bacterium]
MPKICRSCGKENRDEAVFCSECGVPLAKKNKEIKQSPAQRAKNEKIKKFRRNIIAGGAAAVIIILIVMMQVRQAGKLKTVLEYAEKYKQQDEAVFSGISSGNFSFEGLSWGMNIAAVKSVYPFAEESNDPDFTASLMIPRENFKKDIPHAGFMSLGIYMGALYAAKIEFSPSKEHTRQQVKIPDSDERLFGRFLGLYRTFEKLYGKPSYSKYEVEDEKILDRIKLIKKGTLPSGKKSNVYMYWTIGDTRAELVSFGDGSRIYVTVRFLNMPLFKMASGR